MVSLYIQSATARWIPRWILHKILHIFTNWKLFHISCQFFSNNTTGHKESMYFCFQDELSFLTTCVKPQARWPNPTWHLILCTPWELAKNIIYAAKFYAALWKYNVHQLHVPECILFMNTCLCLMETSGSIFFVFEVVTVPKKYCLRRYFHTTHRANYTHLSNQEKQHNGSKNKRQSVNRICEECE